MCVVDSHIVGQSCAQLYFAYHIRKQYIKIIIRSVSALETLYPRVVKQDKDSQLSKGSYAMSQFSPFRMFSVLLLYHTGNVTRNMEVDYKYVKVKINFTREQATKAQRESRGIALLFL